MDINVASSAACAPIEGRLLLPDGRELAYAEYGSRVGYPVVLMHGAPGSRYEVGPDMAAAAARLGVRIIVPDRPGYGGSAVQPGRTLQDWSRDVQALGRKLDLGRFSVAGYSMGGLYALACAHGLPNLIDRVAVIGGLGPIDGPQATEGMSLEVAGLFALAQSDPAALKNAVLPFSESPAALLQAMGAPMPACDQAILQERHQVYLDEFTESLRPGVDGFVTDFVIATRPWGFAPADIGVPVSWWHGELDRNVPPAMARRVVGQLRQGTCQMLPHEGHLILAAHWEEVLRALVPR